MVVSRIIGVISPDTSAVASVAQSASAVTLLALNDARKGASIFNNSNRRLYVKLGSGASLSSYSVTLPARAFYELPFPVYTGIITGLWAAAGGGAAEVTELS